MNYNKWQNRADITAEFTITGRTLYHLKAYKFDNRYRYTNDEKVDRYLASYIYEFEIARESHYLCSRIASRASERRRQHVAAILQISQERKRETGEGKKEERKREGERKK